MSSAWMKHALALSIDAAPSDGVTASGRPRKGASALSQKAALMVLAYHHHPDSDRVSMGVRRVAECAGMSPQAAQRALAALIRSRVLVDVSGNGTRGSYRLAGVATVHPGCSPGVGVDPGCTSTQGVHDRQPWVDTTVHPGCTRPSTLGGHVEYGVRESRGDTPQPPAGGPAPEVVADVPPKRGVDIDSVADRFDAKREARASAGADNAGPAPHLTGNEGGDAAAVFTWWCSMAPLGQVSDMDKSRKRQAIAARGPRVVLEALRTMRERGVVYPQIRAVAQCIRAITTDQIAAERARDRGTRDERPQWARGRDVFEWGAGK